MSDDQQDNNGSQEERKFSQEQYDMLKRCSKAEDMSEWNEWRYAHPDENILLEGRDFHTAYLVNANLGTKGGIDSKIKVIEFTGEVFLAGADFHGATLDNIDFEGANLENADFGLAHLKEANFLTAKINGAIFQRAYIRGANFTKSIVDGSTLIWECRIDRKTNFSGVGLDATRIHPGTKQLIECNVRRKNWEGWYRDHKFLQWPVKWFWGLSDYGISTGRVLRSFFVLAMLFALVYYVWGCVDVYGLGIEERPGVVSNLFVLEDTNEAVAWNQVPIRSIYFSVITMTTLGFGDMYANPATINDNPYAQARSGWGHFLLMVQVLLGYVMLGALVTRFAVLFTAGGPAGSFTEISDWCQKNK